MSKWSTATRDTFSCLECIHFRACKWRKEPYTGNFSGGFPSVDYDRYKQEWYRLQGRFCEVYYPGTTSTGLKRNSEGVVIQAGEDLVIELVSNEDSNAEARCSD